MLSDAEKQQLTDLIVADLNQAEFEMILRDRCRKEAAYFTSSTEYATVVRAALDASGPDWPQMLLAALLDKQKPRSRVGKRAGDLLYQRWPGVGLQTVVPGSDTFEWSLQWEAMSLIDRRVCMLEIGGNAAGTGVLVGEDCVLTACHVIEPLMQGNPLQPVPIPDLKCRFDFGIFRLPDGTKEARTGVRYGVANVWLLAWSPTHPFEPLRKPPPPDEPVDKFDYALIRLAEPAGRRASSQGVERGWVHLKQPARALEAFEPISISQYPSGQALKGANGRVTLIPPHGARVQHNASTSASSSGSPCWNEDFDLVAIHNFGNIQVPNGLENQGIPIDRIVADIVAKLGPASLAPYSPPPPAAAAPAKPRAWSLGADYPILNRVKLQSEIQGLLLEDGGQLLSIKGPRYSGRTFSTKIAQKVVGRLGHVAVQLSALSLIDASPEELLAQIRSLLGMPAATPAQGAEFSTRASEVNRHLLDGFLVDVRQKYPFKPGETALVWLLFDALDQAKLKAETHEFLIAMLTRLSEAPALRVILIGYERELPADVAAIAAEEEIASVSAADIGAHLRHVCEVEDYDMTEAKLDALAKKVLGAAPADAKARLNHIGKAVQNLSRLIKAGNADGNG